MAIDRRDFLQALASGVLISTSGPGVSRAATGQEQTSGWYDRPMRWAQLAFVEDDPGNYDPAFWLDYFRRIHADAACLSAGGCVAFYPTKIPLHYRSKWLGDLDTFGGIVKGCRDLGMNVIARTDAHACHQDMYDAHPDWIMVDAKGEKVRHWSDRDFWVTCALGPYNFEFMTSVQKEVMTLYRVDGIFTNRWAGSGMCYCLHCQENFRAFSGMDLPRTNDPQNPARREYIVWRQKRLFELWRVWDDTIKSINPDASFIPNTGGGALSGLNMKTIGERAPTLFADRQGRSGLMPPWINGKNAKEYRATLGRKAIVGIFSVGLEDKYRWKDSVQNGNEIRTWVVDGIAHNFRPWFTKFNAKPIDRRWLPVVEELYNWHYQNEKYLRNESSLARVAMVYSQQTAAFYGGEQARAKVENPSLGFYQALVEARIPFEMVHDELLDTEHLAPFRTLILPNIAALSEKQCGQIRQFVNRGGSLVATWETSLYNEWGVRRNEFGLASLFGTSFAGRTEGPMQNSYLTLEKDPATGRFHPLLAGLEDATRIINGVNRVIVKPAMDGSYSPLVVVPSYPNLPMEEVFPRPDKMKEAGVFIREFGQGRVVYFPWDVGRTFWEVLNTDHGTLLRNAVLWATNEPRPVTVEGPGVIDLSVWAQKNSMTVHLVNLTNPMLMKGPVREIIPIHRQQVRVRIPDGRHVKKVHLLVGKTDIAYRLQNGAIEVEVPSVGLHEVVAIDFAA
ncbi:MAG TPA: beta-galactosidase trimerization domain-containing protein [Terriglobia bacterium]|nr:beta-galactosidase trimerization domain-containing protein [Terriglobia bacterium]